MWHSFQRAVQWLKLWQKSEKVNLSESVSRNWENQMVWNSHSFSINVLTHGVSNFVQIGRPDHRKRTVFQRVVSKRLYRHFGKSREKVNLSESGSRDLVDQIVWNLNTLKINILTQCVSNFVQIGRPDHRKRTVFQRVVSKRLYRHFGKSREKVNLSESGSRDLVDQIVWNLNTLKINILTQCVSNFVQIGPPDDKKATFFYESFQSAVIEALAKAEKGSIFRKAVLRIELTKLSQISTSL